MATIASMNGRATALLLVAIVIAIAACSPGQSGGPTAATGSPTPVATSPGSAGPGLPSQTSTEWGTIWDAIPADFPVPPGATPATDSGQGPTSALLAVEGDPVEVAGFYASAFEDRGLLVVDEGPLEDGRVTLDASDGYDCRMQVVVRPAGALNLIAILYGAACPFD